MKTKYYPYPNFLIDDICKNICGEHCGIIHSVMSGPLRYTEDIDICSVTGQMPHYHKILMDPKMDIQYHLTGYGIYYEEAIIRLVGEAIERYSLIASHHAMKDRFKFATYNQIKKEGNVLPFQYLSHWNENDYRKLSTKDTIREITENDVIGWLKCPSLFHKGEEIWMPNQLLFVGYVINKAANEMRFGRGFSTGTAAHVSLEKALLNAIIECIQIDALMINWYTMRQAPRVVVDNVPLLNHYDKLLGKNSNYDVVVYDLTLLETVQTHVFGIAIINKNDERPFIVYGAQGELNPLKAFYRGFMEAVAIMFLGLFGPLYAPKQYFDHPDVTSAAFLDLDTNVGLFAIPNDTKTKRDLFYGMLNGKKMLSSMENYEQENSKEELQKLISELSTVSEYAVYLDVTPPETRDKGWYVMRAFIPELVTMCVPGVPYTNHPRFQKYGGIKNKYPHPLP